VQELSSTAHNQGITIYLFNHSASEIFYAHTVHREPSGE